jgi:hypothetical protein
MLNKSSYVVAVTALLLTQIFVATSNHAQDAAGSSLADQLKAQYKLAKRGSDSSGGSIVEAGTVLTIQKGGILGVPLSNVAMATATYKDGNLRGPSTFAAGFIGGGDSRQLPIGEKVYVTRIDVQLKKDKIMFTIVECDSCNGVQQPSSYKSAVIFQFPKDYLSKADVTQVTDVITQVLAPPTEEQQQPQAQSDQQSPTNEPTAPPSTIEIGQTVEQVKAALGQPTNIVKLGAKQIYLYKDLKVTFTDGKVSDVQ